MLRLLSIPAILGGFFARLAITSALGGICYVLLGRFMLMLGTPAFYLYERYHSSPIGIFCGALTAIVGYVALGYVIARIARRGPFVNITAFLILEFLIFLLALGLNVPGYYRAVAFGEALIYTLTVAGAYAGGLLVNRNLL